MVTVSLTTNFLRAGVGALRAEGHVRQSGRSLLFCEGAVFDEQGELVATGIGTFKVLRAPAAKG